MKRSKFSLSHYRLSTFDMGQIIPLAWYEALPGDTFSHATSALIRCSPLLAPVMHPVRVRIHHFFVPLRLIWEDFEDFITGGPEGTSTPQFPYIWSSTAIAEGSLHDHLGVPPSSDYYSKNLYFSALPLRAYDLIYNNFYRDQDLTWPVTISLASGYDYTTASDILHASWSKDYFTTARPWPQKGPSLSIPLTGAAPVVTNNQVPRFRDVGSTQSAVDLKGSYVSGNAAPNLYGTMVSGTSSATFSADMRFDTESGLEADLTAVPGVDISDLRVALALQRYEERRATYGSRYVEYLRSLGVRSSDSRLQIPEYLGGGRQIIQFSEVLQTGYHADSPIGAMFGHGVSALRSNRWLRFFEEHGIVMTLMSVLPRPIYTSSLHRSFRRQIKEDYFQHELQHIGDQEVYNWEVQSADHSAPTDVFGYQSRYDEYRSHPSSIAGEFRSTFDFWHLARQFASDAVLNGSFVTATPTKRVFADQDADGLLVMANHHVRARRMISKVARPRTF